jgi:predicted oxidoreductase
MSRTVKVTLKFTEEQLDRILYEAMMGSTKAPGVKNLTPEQFALLEKELVESASDFAEVIVETTRDAAANGWLEEMTEQFFD